MNRRKFLVSFGVTATAGAVALFNRALPATASVPQPAVEAAQTRLLLWGDLHGEVRLWGDASGSVLLWGPER